MSWPLLQSKRGQRVLIGIVLTVILGATYGAYYFYIPPSTPLRNMADIPALASLTQSCACPFSSPCLGSGSSSGSAQAIAQSRNGSTNPSPWLIAGERPRNQSRITILQHFSMLDPRAHTLQSHSMDQHERYARFWGYDYRPVFSTYVRGEDKTKRQRQTNKLYALMELALGELAKGADGAEWILMTDADVLIHDPLIPLHALLPPDSLEGALILGTEDHNGFNSGNMLFRAGPSGDLVYFAAQALAVLDDTARAFDSAISSVPDARAHLGDIYEQGVDGVESSPSDQRAICLALDRVQTYDEGFYHYPPVWLNAYPASKAGGDGIRLNTHMVNRFKDHGLKIAAELRAERRAWEKVEGMKREELEREVEGVKGRAMQYWMGYPRRGRPRCSWI